MQNKKNNPLLIISAIAIILYITQSTWMPVVAKIGILNNVSLPRISNPIIDQQRQQYVPVADDKGSWYSSDRTQNVENAQASYRCATLTPEWFAAHPKAGTYQQFLQDNPQCNQP